MDTNLLIPALVSVTLALLGYLFTYFNNLRLSQRTERLERVNKQLGELYGPLYSIAHASDIAWRAFRSKYRPRQAYFRENPPPTDEELEAWRLWMSTVFMPMNLRMYELVLSKADLFVEQNMPDSLLLLCAHVAAYQTVLEKWENNDYSEHTSLLEYPSEKILEYTKQSYKLLKTEQAKLLGKST